MSTASAPTPTPTAPYLAEHATLAGPGDARPTALRIIDDDDLRGALRDRVMLVTGATSGIGLETVRALAATGARVFMTARNKERGQEVRRDIVERLEGVIGRESARIEVVGMELGRLESVRKAAEEVKGKTERLDVLVCNAGVMACPESRTHDGFETQLGTNHLGHFLLFQLLKPLLLSSSSPTSASRVIMVSSRGHRNKSVQLDDLDFSASGYSPWAAYGQSKTANIWMANQIERAYGSRGIHALSLDPGGISTGLQKYMDSALIERFSKDPEVIRFSKSTEQGAATTVWAAVGKVWEGRGGRYLEDCKESGPRKTGGTSAQDEGYAPWAFDEEGERRLWEISCRLVGVEDE
ncbi:hypothetical protein H2201_005529 [Coniosporium apollinis]|uniref:Short-chain dehydrogenase n=1 Tax=Coniosporium apollinis TaxID=61459 RepID=A0ABQ9NPG2_9PEZI|nr:hypothetical protein H2201_005529 [Coniosporium apollinis]